MDWIIEINTKDADVNEVGIKKKFSKNYVKYA